MPPSGTGQSTLVGPTTYLGASADRATECRAEGSLEVRDCIAAAESIPPRHQPSHQCGATPVSHPGAKGPIPVLSVELRSFGLDGAPPMGVATESTGASPFIGSVTYPAASFGDIEAQWNEDGSFPCRLRTEPD